MARKIRGSRTRPCLPGNLCLRLASNDIRMKISAPSSPVLPLASLLGGLLLAAGCGTGSTPRDLMMEEASRAPVDFPRPGGVVDIEICADSGTRPGPGCGGRHAANPC